MMGNIVYNLLIYFSANFGFLIFKLTFIHVHSYAFKFTLVKLRPF